MGTSPDSIRAVGEGDLTAITGVARTTLQNWVARGVLHLREDHVFGATDVLVVGVVAQLVAALGLEGARSVWRNGEAPVTAALAALGPDGELDLVVDSYTYDADLVTTAEELWVIARSSAWPDRLAY